MSWVPIIVTKSATIKFLDISFKDCKWKNPGALILNLYGNDFPSDTKNKRTPL